MQLFLLSWVCGCVLMWYGASYVVPATTDEVADKYENALMAANLQQTDLSGYHAEVKSAKQRLYAETPWFSWLQSASPGQQRAQRQVNEAEANLHRARKEQQLQVYKAKALVGVFSDYAVDEAREKFWKSIESGQSFGKRMTFWDAIFSIGSSRRDDSAGAFIMRWVMRIIWNFTIGLVGAVFIYAFQLGSIVMSYSPNPVAGTVQLAHI